MQKKKHDFMYFMYKLMVAIEDFEQADILPREDNDFSWLVQLSS